MALAEVWAASRSDDSARFREAQDAVLEADRLAGSQIPAVPACDVIECLPASHFHAARVPSTSVDAIRAVFGERYTYATCEDGSGLTVIKPNDLTRQDFQDGWARLMCHEAVTRTAIEVFDTETTSELFKHFFVRASSRASTDLNRLFIKEELSPEPYVPPGQKDLEVMAERAGDGVRQIAVALTERTDAKSFTAFLGLVEMSAVTIARRYATANGADESGIEEFMKDFTERVRGVAKDDSPPSGFLIGGSSGGNPAYRDWTGRQLVARQLIYMMAFFTMGYIFWVLSESACGEIARAKDAEELARSGSLQVQDTPAWDLVFRAVNSGAGKVATYASYAYAPAKNLLASVGLGSPASAQEDLAWGLVADVTTALAERPSQCVGWNLAFRGLSIGISSGYGMLYLIVEIALNLGIRSASHAFQLLWSNRQDQLQNLDPRALPRATNPRQRGGKEEEEEEDA